MEYIYVIISEHGSYSDWSKDYICAFIDKEKAEEYCKKLNDSNERCKLAQNELYEYIEKWQENAEGSNKYNSLLHEYDKLSRIPKDNLREKQKQALTKISNDIYNLRVENKQKQKEAEAKFIFSLSYLTEEEKKKLTNSDSPQYYSTEEHYFVEKLELLG